VKCYIHTLVILGSNRFVLEAKDLDDYPSFTLDSLDFTSVTEHFKAKGRRLPGIPYITYSGIFWECRYVSRREMSHGS
jgi:hypothetical protein